MHLIVALDGPAGAGKSTVAKRVAAALGVRFLDTGAMYRAVTLKALELDLEPSDGVGLGQLTRKLAIDFDEEGRVLVGGRCLEPAIRAQDVTRHVSEVSAHGSVREAVVARQQEFGRSWPGLVAEGRDTTTVVFAEAAHKFYLDASSRERALRRAKQEGREEALAEIQADIVRRDHHDSTRKHSPLRVAEDAQLIDTDGKAIKDVVAELLVAIRGGAA
jgi:cytidylate kinase